MHFIHQDTLNLRENIDFFWNKLAELSVMCKLHPKFVKIVIQLFQPNLYKNSNCLSIFNEHAKEMQILPKDFFIKLKFLRMIANIIQNSLFSIFDFDNNNLMDPVYIEKLRTILSQFISLNSEAIQIENEARRLPNSSRQDLQNLSSLYEISHIQENLEIICCKMDVILYLKDKHEMEILEEHKEMVKVETGSRNEIDMFEINKFYRLALDIIKRESGLDSIQEIMNQLSHGGRPSSPETNRSKDRLVQKIQKSKALNLLAIQNLNNIFFRKFLKKLEVFNGSTEFLNPDYQQVFVLFCLVGLHKSSFYENFKEFMFVRDESGGEVRDFSLVSRCLLIFEELKLTEMVSCFRIGISRLLHAEFLTVPQSQAKLLFLNKREFLNGFKVRITLIYVFIGFMLGCAVSISGS